MELALKKFEMNLKRMLFRYQLLYKLGSLQISLVSLAARLTNIDVVDIEWQKFSNTQIYGRKQLELTKNAGCLFRYNITVVVNCQEHS